MLNEKRVRHMTRMAMFEKNEGPNYSGLLNVDKKDYLSFSDVGAFIGGSIFYIVAASLLMIAVIGFFVRNISVTFALLAALGLVIGYVLFIYFYRRWMHERAWMRYEVAARQIRKLKQDYRILEEMYETEEREKAPSVSLDDELI